MSKRFVLLAAALAVAISLGAPAASAPRRLMIGIYDPAYVFSNPDAAFKTLRNLRVQVMRVPLDWGAVIARKKPASAADPDDPAYHWELIDRVVTDASKSKIKVLLSIYGTPRWANGSKKGLNRLPARIGDLQKFAFAAATRYSGKHKTADGTTLPAVRMWLAWNEPNNPVYLKPQFRRVGRRWIVQSARDYAKICAAVYAGVHGTKLVGERVACGGTGPRGNNQPRSARPSVSPLTFLLALKKSRLRRFDVYAHHPYAISARETPTTRPRKGAVTLANIGDLVGLLTRLYGRKPLWITEYGYQTNPPDRLFGVSWSKQARYLKQAYSLARKDSRIQLMLWFLVRDESRLGGWQSGFFTASGKRKPSYNAYRSLRR